MNTVSQLSRGAVLCPTKGSECLLPFARQRSCSDYCPLPSKGFTVVPNRGLQWLGSFAQQSFLVVAAYAHKGLHIDCCPLPRKGFTEVAAYFTTKHSRWLLPISQKASQLLPFAQWFMAFVPRWPLNLDDVNDDESLTLNSHSKLKQTTHRQWAINTTTPFFFKIKIIEMYKWYWIFLKTPAKIFALIEDCSAIYRNTSWIEKPTARRATRMRPTITNIEINPDKRMTFLSPAMKYL